MINYGVIVGRFQVNSLHAGHLELFRQVSEKHDRVIVFIGVPRTAATKRNPMDFETRKKMIQADYPDFIILPLRDEKHDNYWSSRLDDSIASVTQFTGDITLYGGRDSFVPHYYGVHQVHQLEIPSPVSGTEIRSKLTNRVMQSPDFRAGVIYSVSNQFPRVFSTVDAAVLYDPGDRKIKILLAKKPGETEWRFPGGFIEKGESAEQAAHREVYEETKLDISSVEYIGSFPVNDWRYANDPDAGITTTLFIGWTTSLRGKPDDDIAEIKWFDFQELPTVILAGHQPLLEAVKKFIGKRYYATQSAS